MNRVLAYHLSLDIHLVNRCMTAEECGRCDFSNEDEECIFSLYETDIENNYNIPKLITEPLFAECSKEDCCTKRCALYDAKTKTCIRCIIEKYLKLRGVIE